MNLQVYDISIVIPAFNEVKTLEKIILDTFAVFKDINRRAEIIVVNDGSNDGTEVLLENLQSVENDLLVIEHSRSLGKSRCLVDGFKIASGKYIGFIDADYQFHPSDFPTLLQALENRECDLANGFRKKREDPLSKRFASKIFNTINRLAFRGLKSRDWNCGIKLMRADVAKSFFLRKGYHRFILGMAYNKGYSIKEFPIKHTQREFGKSKYGVMRLFSGPFDVLALKMKFVISERPFTIFGLLGILLIFVGFVLGLLLVYEQQILGQSIGNRPLLILVVLFILFGFQMFIFGYIAEKLVDIETLNNPRISGFLKHPKDRKET